MSAFENFGRPAPAGPDDRMECGVCWLVYDPAEGDPVWQVAPGTPFRGAAGRVALPELRRAARAVHRVRAMSAAASGAEGAAAEIGRRIAARYRAIADGPMAGLPVCNPALGVADVGFRALDGEAVGIVVTPWFMNVVAAHLPDEPPPPPAAPGATVRASAAGRRSPDGRRRAAAASAASTPARCSRRCTTSPTWTRRSRRPARRSRNCSRAPAGPTERDTAVTTGERFFAAVSAASDPAR